VGLLVFVIPTRERSERSLLFVIPTRERSERSLLLSFRRVSAASQEEPAVADVVSEKQITQRHNPALRNDKVEGVSGTSE
jgi:hypothetical protein